MKLLHVDSSILGDASASRALTARFVEGERRRTPGLTVMYRDLAAEPLEHLSAAHLSAAQAGVGGLPGSLRRDLERGQEALEQFLAADVVVIGAPMYNFSIPSQLKAWIDRVCVAGKTFEYTAAGPRGLAGGRRVIIVTTRGGVYAPNSPWANHQESYLRGVFEFLGITDITVIRAEGLSIPSQREPALRVAQEAVAAAA